MEIRVRVSKSKNNTANEPCSNIKRIAQLIQEFDKIRESYLKERQALRNRYNEQFNDILAELRERVAIENITEVK